MRQKQALIFILFIILFSCEPDDCYLCRTDIIKTIGTQVVSNTYSLVEQCGMNAEQVLYFESVRTHTREGYENGFKVVTESKCKCVYDGN